MASKESRPISDHRASAEYRRMMVEVLVKRTIHLVLSGA
jgi:xanthine dehydrogenase iron-sulfur cluster and FAD-binding subunit A